MRDRGIKLPWDMDSATDATPADRLNPTNAAALGQIADALEDSATTSPDAPLDAPPGRPSDTSWEESFGRADAEITTRVDVSAFREPKRRSMDCHKTQRQDLGWLLDLPDDLADRAISTEYFVLRWLDGADVPASRSEDWLLP